MQNGNVFVFFQNSYITYIFRYYSERVWTKASLISLLFFSFVLSFSSHITIAITIVREISITRRKVLFLFSLYQNWTRCGDEFRSVGKKAARFFVFSLTTAKSTNRDDPQKRKSCHTCFEFVYSFEISLRVFSWRRPMFSLSFWCVIHIGFTDIDQHRMRWSNSVRCWCTFRWWSQKIVILH